jgi:hypothetical protein|tara:strand:- start:149 stop:739 length:591 start_codon:yes stop_codon:yes gene_type:complete
MGAVLKESMWDREEYFKGISVVKIAAFVLFLFGMMVMVGQVNGQDNKTETKPNVTTPYVPSKVKQEAGKYGDTQYWPYPSWQITGYVNNCVNTFPQQYPQIRQFLWPTEMGAFCSCVMDKFRQEWAYDDYVQNFQLRPSNEPIPPVLGELLGDYAQECTGKVVEHRSTGVPYAPDPDGKIRRDFQTGKLLNKQEET